MKRILFPLLLCLAACQGDPKPSDSQVPDDTPVSTGVEIFGISAPESIDIAENAEAVKVPVALDPSNRSASFAMNAPTFLLRAYSSASVKPWECHTRASPV